ncbi:MAG TPA: hypothetical protein VIL00_18935 [Pseudonocardiaceae bacterium]
MASNAGRTVLFPLAVVLSVAGLVALAAVFGLFALGHGDLPVWLNVAAGLFLPLGLALGLLDVVRAGRRR